jgi:hypothetical protein
LAIHDVLSYEFWLRRLVTKKRLADDLFATHNKTLNWELRSPR